MSETQPRPTHTTLAAGLVIGGSVGVVLGVAEQLAGLHSLETREAVTAFLSEPPGSSLGLGVTGALQLLRVALMVVAGCATAAAVLGYHVLRRSHRARVGLSLLALPIFFGGLAAGGFLTSLVAASSLLLWIGPSAAWFRGEDPQRPGANPFDTPQRPAASAGPPATDHPEPQPPEPGSPTPSTAAGPVVRTRRPDALVWACVLTWALTALTMLVLAASAVLMTTSPDLVLDELRRQGRPVPGSDVDLLRVTTYVLVGVVGVWSLAAMVVAGFAYSGVRWARTVLVVSAASAAVLCLVVSLSTPLALLPGVACLVVVFLLNRHEVRGWPPRS